MLHIHHGLLAMYSIPVQVMGHQHPNHHLLIVCLLNNSPVDQLRITCRTHNFHLINNRGNQSRFPQPQKVTVQIHRRKRQDRNLQDLIPGRLTTSNIIYNTKWVFKTFLVLLLLVLVHHKITTWAHHRDIIISVWVHHHRWDLQICRPPVIHYFRITILMKVLCLHLVQRQLPIRPYRT